MSTCPLCSKTTKDLSLHLKKVHKLEVLESSDVQRAFGVEPIIEVANCRVQVNCPQRWELMQPTPFEDLRFCSTCNQNVLLAKNAEQLNWATNRNHCAAVLTTNHCMIVGMFAGPDDES
jgi:hypothetical protein